jgi:ubiquitin carboxyl-terminal hydrolase 14
MNATIQCLRSVPELRESLKEFNDEINFASPQSITLALKSVFEQMEKNSTVTPILLLQTLHMAFPNFAQTGENG